MRIQEIENIPLEIPLKKNFGGSTYNVLKRCTVITRIKTDDGLVSQVYNGDSRDHSKDIIHIIQNELAPILIGETALEIEKLWEKMFLKTLAHPQRKLVLEAIACVDTALWDLLGKACSKNVSTLLGGYRQSLPIISIAGYYEKDKTLNDLAKEMDWLKSNGMAGCKVKVGGLSPDQDAARVAAARDGAGDDFILAVDANRGWNVKDAIRFARLIENLDICWFEEPCHWYDDASMMAQVRSQTHIPINAGQSEASGHGVRRLLAANAVDYVNLDASESGGITEWRRVAGMCALHGVKMAHHEEPQIATQMLAATSNGSYVECFADIERDPLWPQLVANRPLIKNGIINVPQGPGFDLELDLDFIKKYRIDN